MAATPTVAAMGVAAAVEEGGRRQQGLATTRALHAARITRSALSRAVRAGEVVRVRRGVYALGPLGEWPPFVVTHEGVAAAYVRQVRAVLLSLGEGAVAAGPTAACLRGWGLLHEPHRTVHLVVPHGRGRVRLPHVQAVQRRQPRRESLQVLKGQAPLWVTGALETVLDCCAQLPLLEAVVVCDSALRAGAVTLAQLEAAAAGRHVRRVRRALALADPESGSVLESVLRVLMVQAGIGGFSTQHVLHDGHGRRILRVDFCFERARLVVEVDGARWHPDRGRDQRIDNRLAAAGWRVLRVGWSDVVHDSDAVLRLVQAALLSGSSDIQDAPAASARAA